ncbi:MAG: peptidoglycan-binding protein [Myxococcaceae bacterium]|nr:peptidoglycan-binding protein [Myxococcaceae bacterium]
MPPGHRPVSSSTPRTYTTADAAERRANADRARFDRATTTADTAERRANANRTPAPSYGSANAAEHRAIDQGVRSSQRLAIGAKGDDVKKLQTLLAQRLEVIGNKETDPKKKAEYLKAAEFMKNHIDGDFGPKTQNAVKLYQRAQGLLVDGIVADQTWTDLLSVGLEKAKPGSVLVGTAQPPAPPASVPGQVDDFVPAGGGGGGRVIRS